MVEGQATRVPYITSREQVPADLRDHFDSIAGSRGFVQGPFSVLLNSPEIAGRTAHLGAYIRFEGELRDADRELAILTTSREFDCAYEWAAHEPIARDAGVSDAAIDAVASKASLDDLDEAAARIVRYGRELFRENRVSDGTFEAVSDTLGPTGVTELTATFGYYGMLATVLNALEVVPTEGAPRPW